MIVTPTDDRRNGYSFSCSRGTPKLESTLNAATLPFPSVALVSLATALLWGCSSTTLRDDYAAVTAQIAASSDESALPDVGARLAALGQGADASVVIPDSGFIDQDLDGVQTLPFRPLGRDLGTEIVIGQAGDDRYRAGVGWVEEQDANKLKLSLFRQQTVDGGFDGLWLSSLQGETTPPGLGDDFRLKGELAVAADGTSDRTAGGSGIRVQLLRKPVNGFNYGFNLSQFSEGFRPYDSVVDAGERRAGIDLGYVPWPGARMSADAGYILDDWDGDAPCDQYRTGLALSTSLFNALSAKLESSAQRALDCALASGAADQDSWALTLSEKNWTGWNLNLVAGISERRMLFVDENRIKHHYRLSGDHGLRLGMHDWSFGPEVSLQSVDDGDIERRLRTGVVMGVETRSQDFSLHLGYETLTGPAGTLEEHAGRINLKYRLDFDA